jgi:hypothetical protein
MGNTLEQDMPGWVSNLQEHHHKNRFEMIPNGDTGVTDIDALRLNCHSIIRDSKTGFLVLSFYDDVENKVYKALDNWTNCKNISFDIIGFNGNHEVARKIHVTAKSELTNWSTYIDFSWADSSRAPSIDLTIRVYDRLHTRY